MYRVAAAWGMAIPSLMMGVAFGQPLPGMPQSRVEPVKDVIHGVEIVDDYRWLEGDNSVEGQWGKSTNEVSEWTDYQNAYTRSVLDNLPGRKELEEKLRPLMEVGSISAPGMRGDRYFYSKREGNENQPRIFMRKGSRGEPKLLLDPAKMDASGLVTISWTVPNKDGTQLAYGTYRAGDENSTLHIMNTDTGEVSPIQISGKVSSIDWLPDSSGFMYRNLADIGNPYSGQVKFHRIGKSKADGSDDALLFRQYTPEENLKLATTYGPGAGLSEDGKWAVVSYSTDTRNNDLWIVNFEDYLKTGKFERRDVIVGEAAQSGGPIVGDTMFMLTTFGAANGRIMKVNLNHPERENWKEFVPERKDAVIEGVSIAKGVLVVDYLTKASTHIELVNPETGKATTLKLPGIGSAGLSTDQDRTEAYLSFTSFNYPPTIFQVDLAKPDAEPVLWESPAVPVDPTSVEVKQEWYTSKDGTKVSMFIVHKKGLALKGDSPTILYGYGGFTVSLTPTFSASLFQWLDAGGVYAVPNLRGGGEYGDKWHTEGMRDKKQNVFDDFIAAAEFLCDKGYTNPSKLAVRGGSNGGLLTGAVLTQRPDLFKAVLVHVPLLDMVRFQNFLMAKYWVPEYGSAEDAEQFAYIKKYSPYHNIRKGTKYPATLLTAGENDSRVHPLHARKMAAALQAATASDPATAPILLWVDREAGHGQGKPLNLRIRDVADERIFVMWQLGMLEGKGK